MGKLWPDSWLCANLILLRHFPFRLLSPPARTRALHLILVPLVALRPLCLCLCLPAVFVFVCYSLSLVVDWLRLSNLIFAFLHLPSPPSSTSFGLQFSLRKGLMSTQSKQVIVSQGLKLLWLQSSSVWQRHIAVYTPRRAQGGKPYKQEFVPTTNISSSSSQCSCCLCVCVRGVGLAGFSLQMGQCDTLQMAARDTLQTRDTTQWRKKSQWCCVALQLSSDCWSRYSSDRHQSGFPPWHSSLPPKSQ